VLRLLDVIDMKQLALATFTACGSATPEHHGPDIIVRDGGETRGEQCPLAGEPDTAIYNVVVAFAGAHLRDPWVFRHGSPHDPIRPFVLGPGESPSDRGKGFAIEIDARSELGRFSVGYYTGSDTGFLYYGADYCIAVDHISGAETVTIKQIGHTGRDTINT